jgi:hypothetical protein
MAVEERDRILGLLESGKISAEQAAVLLDAVGEKRSAQPAGAPAAPGAPPAPRPPARVLRISIDAHEGGADKAKVHINVPLKLARFAARFMPKEARAELEEQNIDLNELLAGLGDEVPDGPLVDIDASEEDGSKTAKIQIEVV